MVIGITGGVGTGKSTVLEYLSKNYNAICIELDLISRKLIEPDGECYNELRCIFSDDILLPDGYPDRIKIGNIVFNDPVMLKRLNDLIHPAVKKKVVEIIANSNKGDLLLIESAILFETGYGELCDETWFIFTDKEIRIKRLMDSRGYTREKSENIINNQKNDDEFMLLCDFVITNTDDFKKTESQIDDRMKKIVKGN